MYSYHSPKLLTFSAKPSFKPMPMPKKGFTAKPTGIIDPAILVKIPRPILDQVTQSAASGDFDPNQGIEQFPTSSRVRINKAIETGDMSQLSSAEKAFIDYQVAARKAALEEEMGADEAALQQAASEEAAVQAAEFAEKQANIAKAKRMQLIINGGVFLVGGAIIYYLIKD